MSGAARSHSRDAAYLVGSQIVASGCTFVLAVVIARALGAEGKGFYDVTAASASLLVTFSGFSLASGIFFHTARGGVNHRRLLVALLAAAAVLGAATALALGAWGTHPALSWLLPLRGASRAALLVGVLLMVLHAQQFVQAVTKGLGRFRAFAASEVLAKGGALAAALALAVAGVATADAYVAAVAAATLASVALLVAATWRAPAPRDPVPWGAVFAYSLPLFLGNAVQFLNYRLDVFFVKSFLGLEAVGQYTVAVALTQVLWLIPNALGVLVMRAIAEGADSGDALERVALVNRFCFALSAVGAGMLALAAVVALPAVFGDDFRASVIPLLLLAPGVTLFSQTIVLSAYFNGIQKQAYTTWVACGSLAVTVALDLLLIPRLGVAGAALASTASYTASSAATLWLLARRHPGVPLAPFLLPQPADRARVAGLVRAGLARARVRRGGPGPVPGGGDVSPLT